MLENPVLQAALYGIACAASLPVGAALGVLLKPGPRLTASVLAVGCGALIAALIVGPTRPGGDAWFQLAGILAGGLLFKLLGGFANRRGGFLRKAATAFAFGRGKAQARLRVIREGLVQGRVLEHLTAAQWDRLAAEAVVRHVPKGAVLYRASDRAEALHIVEEGQVQLLDPKTGRRPYEFLDKNSAFGRLSFLTGSCRGTEAIAAQESRLLVIPRRAFLDLAEESPALRESLAERLQERDVKTFLEERNGLTPEQIAEWLPGAVADVRATGRCRAPDAPVPAKSDPAEILALLGRNDFFQRLAEPDLAVIADRLTPHSAHRGETVFRIGEMDSRLYILIRGEVHLADPADPSHPSLPVGPGDVFGRHAFFSETAHEEAAIAMADCEYLVLRRADLLEAGDSARAAYTAEAQAGRKSSQSKSGRKAASGRGAPAPWMAGAADWIDATVRGDARGALLLDPAELKIELARYRAAGLAVVLGLLLDAGGEAVLVGADSVARSVPLNLVLLAGIGLSNLGESLSGAAAMRARGLGSGRILLLWFGLMLASGALAGLGALLAGLLPKSWVFALEGLAIGAALVMVVDNLLPEVYAKSSGSIGLSLLIGFLSMFVLANL